MRKTRLAVLGCLLVVTAACSPPGASRVIATLPIRGFATTLQVTTLAPRTVRVPAGSDFAVVVDTTDGPLAWKLTTAGAPSVVTREGSTPVGFCGGRVGCRVPERYSFRARARGRTTMAWTEYALVCPRNPHQICPAVVQDIRITVT